MNSSSSRFYMWRAVTAMVHADSVVRPHEINFILQSTKNIGLTPEQQGILAEDLERPVDIVACYQNITAPKDKEDFFHLAHAIAWSDGDMDEREKELLNRIRSLAKGQDRQLMEKAQSTFKDLYIDNDMDDRQIEPSVFAFVKNLLRVKRG